MKVIADRAALECFVKLINRNYPGSVRLLRVWACQARIFVSAPVMTTGVEALVLREGGFTVTRAKFLDIITFYGRKRKTNITLEAEGSLLKIGNVEMRCTEYSSQVEAPADFQVFPVTDGWIADKIA